MFPTAPCHFHWSMNTKLPDLDRIQDPVNSFVAVECCSSVRYVASTKYLPVSITAASSTRNFLNIMKFGSSCWCSVNVIKKWFYIPKLTITWCNTSHWQHHLVGEYEGTVEPTLSFQTNLAFALWAKTSMMKRTLKQWKLWNAHP